MPFSSSTTPPHRSLTMRIAVGASAALVVAGLGAFWWASNVARKAPPKPTDGAVTVTIRGNVCDPSDITVPAGRTTFTIVNQSQRALEWEILDGVMVVEERENIAPGFSQTLTAKLQPGEYDITCGLLSNPRGKLRVTASAVSAAEAARPSLINYVGALAEYRVFLALEAGTLEDATGALADALHAGDLAQAQALYLPAHQAYQRIAPMGELFADLDTRLDARADYFGKREEDPAFTGFHRVEYALFGRNDTQDASLAVEPLLADIGLLKQRLRELNVPPERLARAGGRLLRRVSDHLSTDGETTYRYAEVSDLQGTLDGTRKIVELLAPLLEKADPALNQAIARHYDALDATLAPYRKGEGFEPVALDPAQRQSLAKEISAVADELDKINGSLGLD